MRPGDKDTPFKVSVVQNLMVELALSGARSVARVSQELGLSRRTFQRRLSEHDLTFRDLVSQVRRDMAQALLSNTNLPVQDIAKLLGYKKPGAFARAFVRWTGQSPKGYRDSGRP